MVTKQLGHVWTDEEEAIFARIMADSRLGRIQAIQLWKRCRKDANKAIHTANEYPPISNAVLVKLASARAARKGATAKTEMARLETLVAV